MATKSSNTISDILTRLSKQLDRAYQQSKAEAGLKIKTIPSERPDFDVCSPKYVRKALKYMPRDKLNQEKYITDMLNVCSTCATQGDVRAQVKKLRKLPMSGWICYLKTCAMEEPNMRYNDCMTDEERKERLYNNNKAEWKTEALKGCPRGVLEVEEPEFTE